MTDDARFEDAQDQPLRLVATDLQDLEVLAALVQDAVLPATEMTWRPSERSFALLLNRFRWEDRNQAERDKRTYERVRAVLSFGDVTSVASQGIDRKDADTVLSLLTISFRELDAPAGQFDLTFAGDGEIRLTVDCLDATLSDVTRPYTAPSGHVPHHTE